MVSQALSEQISAAFEGEALVQGTEPADVAIETDVVEGTQEELIAEEGEEPVPQEAEQDITTIGQYLEAFGEDANAFYGLKMEMPDGGDAVSLESVKDELTDLRRGNTAHQEQMARKEAELQYYQQQSQQAHSVDQEVKQAEEAIMQIKGQHDSIDWEQAEKTSPGEAALGRQKFAQAMQEARDGLTQAQGNAQMRGQQQTQMAQQQASQYLYEHIPEWKDQQVQVRELNEVRQEWAKHYNPQMVGQITDPAFIMMTRELLQLRRQQGKTTDAVTAVRQSPKGGFRTTGRQTPMSQRKAVADKLVKRAQSTRTKGDKLAAARAIFNSV